MDISVVIPAYNAPGLLISCLSSLARQTTAASYEICVVDDGSGLDEQAIRTRAGCSCPVIWRAFSGNRGRSAARNAGIKATGGDLIVFLDADMEAEPGLLEAHEAMHREHPRTAGIGAIRWPKNGSFYRYIGSRGMVKLKPDASAPPWYFVTGNASIERRDLPDQPVFDESLRGWGGEDLDLGMRLKNAGITVRAVPGACASHHFTGTLNGHVARTESYGRHALPVLAARYPELVRVTRIDRLTSPGIRLLVSQIVSVPVQTGARILDRLPLPDLVFDYLTFAAYARGWLEHVR